MTGRWKLPTKNRKPETPPKEDPKKPAEPDKEDPDKLKGEDKLKKDDKKDPEGNPANQAPAEDPKEVLARIDRNLKKVVDRLHKDELNDATREKQEDILKDLDALINQEENPPPPPQGSQGSDTKPDSGQNQPKPSSSTKPMGEHGNPQNPGQPKTQLASTAESAGDDAATGDSSHNGSTKTGNGETSGVARPPNNNKSIRQIWIAAPGEIYPAAIGRADECLQDPQELQPWRTVISSMPTVGPLLRPG